MVASVPGRVAASAPTRGRGIDGEWSWQSGALTLSEVTTSLVELMTRREFSGCESNQMAARRILEANVHDYRGLTNGLWILLIDRPINNCRNLIVAVTLRVMIGKKRETVIDRPLLRLALWLSRRCHSIRESGRWDFSIHLNPRSEPRTS